VKIVEFVHEALILPELKGRDKPSVLRELAQHLAANTESTPENDPTAAPRHIDADTLYEVLLEREKLASTAIGEGVAIPHGKLDAVGRLVACVGRAKEGVDFDSIDGQPTYLFFVLVAPENSTGSHLKALARISRLFKDPEFRGRLLDAPDGHAMFQIISEEDAKH
jgi:PTS system nitrogen regulatory IIA component